MSMGHAGTFVAAALLASTTALAQTTAPGTTTTATTATTPAQDRESPATQVTLIGCVQKEADYRKEHDLRRGGRLQTGLGDGDEYMLINATRVTPGSAPVAVVGDCTSGSGEAFELTGGMEEKFKAFVGKRVEVTGTQKRAKIGANGQPTGGKDPMGGELNLFEVEVASVNEAAAVAAAEVQRSETAPPPATTAPAPAPAPAVTEPAPAPTPAPEPAPTGTAGQAQTALPHTASPLPLFGLISLLSFAGAFGVRTLRKSDGV